MNGPYKIILIATMIITLFFTSGCASTFLRGVTKANGGRMDVAYPSVRYAGDSLKHPSKLTPLILLDLPLSAALDTAMLPFDAAKGRRPKISQAVRATPLTKEESAKVIEAAIRKAAKKPTGELTKEDLEKVMMLDLQDKGLTSVEGLEKLTQLTSLHLSNNHLTDVKGLENLTQLKSLYLLSNQLTDVKGLEKLTQLKGLFLIHNPELTKAQIDQLKKALPKCWIRIKPWK
jgi:Leucine-rich repeat (LRR) protein